MQQQIRSSDLYLEYFGLGGPLPQAKESTGFCYGFPLTKATVSEASYTTLESGDVLLLSPQEKRSLIRAISLQLHHYLQDTKRLLICGIGNPALTADSLGPAVCARLPACHKEEPSLGISYFNLVPGVPAKTGIPTAQLLQASAKCVEADRILIVDALRATSALRLCSILQLSNTGCTPGSGAGKTAGAAKPEDDISEHTMPCPVVFMGVPTVIRTRLPDGGDREYLVTHSLADSMLSDWASILSSAILRCVLA